MGATKQLRVDHPGRVSSSSDRSRRNTSSPETVSQMNEIAFLPGSTENADNSGDLARILLGRELLNLQQEVLHSVCGRNLIQRLSSLHHESYQPTYERADRSRLSEETNQFFREVTTILHTSIGTHTGRNTGLVVPFVPAKQPSEIDGGLVNRHCSIIHDPDHFAPRKENVFFAQISNARCERKRDSFPLPEQLFGPVDSLRNDVPCVTHKRN